MHIREELGILNRPNTESLLSNGCVIYDSEGNIIWQNTLPIEYIKKFHEIFKSYPNATYSYTYGNGMVGFDEKWAQKVRELIQENVIIENKEEHIKKVISGEKSNINKVSFFSTGPDGESMIIIKMCGYLYKFLYIYNKSIHNLIIILI